MERTARHALLAVLAAAVVTVVAACGASSTTATGPGGTGPGGTGPTGTGPTGTAPVGTGPTGTAPPTSRPTSSPPTSTRPTSTRPTSTRPTSTRPTSTEPGTSVPRTSVPDTAPTTEGTGDPQAKDEEAAIYLALIRNSIGRRSSSPSDRPYAEIVIVDHPVQDAENPASTSDEQLGEPFTSAQRQALTDGLTDLGPVRFVPSAQAGRVQSGPNDEHVLLVLGPVETAGAGVAVGLSKTCGPMCGNGGTQLLERSADGTWRVTGSTGGGWIS